MEVKLTVVEQGAKGELELVSVRVAIAEADALDEVVIGDGVGICGTGIDLDEEVEVVVHNAKGEDLEAAEALKATHNGSENSLFIRPKDLVAINDAANDMISGGGKEVMKKETRLAHNKTNSLAI
jgi:hypothetical protein